MDQQSVYNTLKDLGPVDEKDVPPAFIDKFLEAGGKSAMHAVEAVVRLSQAASGTFEEFQAALGEGVPMQLVAQVLENNVKQTVEREGLAGLQYNWG